LNNLNLSFLKSIRKKERKKMNTINLLTLALVILMGSLTDAFSLFSVNSYLDPSNQYSSFVSNNVAKLAGHRTFYDFKAFDNGK